jgi:CubicO group peptidase (beta-lactamase class C family)
MFRISVAIIAAVLALPAALFSQSPERAQLARVFAAYQHTSTPGCAVGVDAPGRAAWTAAYGMADLEHAVANTPATVFEAGSVSKQFTAAAVLLLVERGQVALDDNIREYFPELPAYDRPITIRQLLLHTSGLRDWGEVEAFAGWPRTTREYTHAHVLGIISRQHALNYLPGDAWSYTNSGYNLAAMLVERVSGMTLQTFSRKEFFEPLGMTSTQWRDDFRRIVPNRAIAYSMLASHWRQDMPFEDAYGNGGLLTTVGDLLKWNRNIASGKLYPSIFALMQKPGSLSDGRSINYGFGLFLPHFETLAEVSHSGATAGYRAWLGRIPAKGLSIAVLCNAGSANPTDYAYKIAHAYLGLPVPGLPAAPRDVISGIYRNVRERVTIKVDNTNGALAFDGHRVPAEFAVRFADDTMFLPDPVNGEDVWERVEQSVPANLSAFAGIYASDEAETVLRVVVEKGNLVIHRRPDASFPLEPTYVDAFASPLGSVHFLRDATGNVVALSLASSRVWDLRFNRQNSDTLAAPR